jgi:hypothetical protein
MESSSSILALKVSETELALVQITHEAKARFAKSDEW